jgi:hypothetical protein
LSSGAASLSKIARGGAASVVLMHRVGRAPLLFSSAQIFGKSGEGGDIRSVGSTPAGPNSWDGNNCDREANVRWFGFDFNRQDRSHHIRSLVQGKRSLLAHDSKFDRNSLFKFPLLVGICSLKSINPDMAPQWANIGISAVALSWIKHGVADLFDSVIIPIWQNGDPVDYCTAMLISRHYVLDDITVRVKTDALGVLPCELTRLDRADNEIECVGDIVLNDGRKLSHRYLGARLLVNFGSPLWETVENDPSVSRLRCLDVDIGNDETLLQKDYLDRRSGRLRFLVGPDNNSGGSNGDDYGSGSTPSQQAKDDKQCEGRVVRLWMMCVWIIYVEGAPSLRFLQGRVAILLAGRFVLPHKTVV